MRSLTLVSMACLVLCCSAFQVMETTISEIQSAFDDGSLTCSQLVQLHLDRISEYDQQGPRINSFVHLNPNASADALQKDAMSASARASQPLWCIPFVAKDNYGWPTVPTTAGSIVLNNTYTKNTAMIVQALLDAGAILMGKTNMPDFAMLGTNTDSSISGQTLNTYNLTVTPSASSGGTGSAISASFGVIGLGSDTQGSIQNPSSVQSLVGLRPTLHMLPSDGILPLSAFQDTGGPMCRTVRDLALTMEIIDTGHTIKRPKVPYTDYLNADALKGVRVAFLNSTLAPQVGSNPDPDVVAVMQQVQRNLQALGAEVVVLNDVAKRAGIWGMINSPAISECSSSTQISDWDHYFQAEPTVDSPIHSFKDLLNAMKTNPNNPPEMTEMMENIYGMAEHPCPQDYDPSCHMWKELKTELGRFNEFARMSANADVLLYPTFNRAPDPINPPPNYPPSLPFSHLSALTGDPALVFPAGYSSDSLPIGATFLGRRYQEPLLIAYAYAYTNAYPVRVPPPTVPPL